MKIKKNILFLLATAICFTVFSCKSNKENTRISHFHYGGYGDSVVGTVQGNAMKIVTLDKIIGAGEFEVEINHSKKIKVNTEMDGSYFFNIENGTYNLKYILNGYEPIIIKNYKSVSDQVTTIDVNFEQGNETQTYIAPKWEK